MLIGAHVSTAGGLQNAVDRGVEIGCEAIQIFHQSPRAWRPTNYGPDDFAAYNEAFAASPLGSTVIAGLVGDRVVKWDDRIIDLDLGFQMHDPAVTAALTVRDTYAHRSGLPDHAGDLLEDMGYARRGLAPPAFCSHQQ